MLIDVQKDFCFPEGTLYVAGRSGTGAIVQTRTFAETAPLVAAGDRLALHPTGLDAIRRHDAIRMHLT